MCMCGVFPESFHYAVCTKGINVLLLFHECFEGMLHI